MPPQKGIREAVTFVMLCHDAKLLCQSYAVCVLETKISCLQHLAKGSNTKKLHMHIFKCCTAKRSFIWDMLLTASGEAACNFGTRFSWNTCFPSTIFLSLWSLFKMKYIFLILFISIWQTNSGSSCMNLTGRSDSCIAKMVGKVFVV